MTKTFTEVRFFKWKEDEKAVSLRAASASYGGGSEVLVIDEPIAFEPGACSRTAGHIYEGGVVGTLRAKMGDNQMAVVTSEPICFKDDITIKIDGGVKR